MSDKELLRDFIGKYGFSVGSFTLTSGLTSNYYFDIKTIGLNPKGNYLISKVLWKLLEIDLIDKSEHVTHLNFDALCGLEFGAVPIMSGFSLYAFMTKGVTCSSLVVRKDKKGYGEENKIEGLKSITGTKVIIIDDVVTTGASIAKTYKACQDNGLHVLKLMAVVDCQEGGRELIKDECDGLCLDPIFTKEQLGGVHDIT